MWIKTDYLLEQGRHCKSKCCHVNPKTLDPKKGASIIRIGFWGTLYCSSSKEPPKSYR